MNRQKPNKRGAQKHAPDARSQLRWFSGVDFGRVLSGFGKALVGAGFFLAIGALWPQLNRPITEVEFTGAMARVDAQELRQTVELALDKGIVRLDITELDAAIERLDWVYAAEIQKIWPEKLSIEIEEEQPVARWGEIGYLAASGEMVTSPGFEDLSNLPSFDVMVASPQEVLDLFYGLNTAMLTTGIALQELNQSEFGSWWMVMENGTEILLGKEDLLVRMQRVMHAWQQLVPEHINDIQAVDARYSNGIAVKYREEVVQQHKQPSGGSNI